MGSLSNLSWLHLLFFVYTFQFNCSASFNSSSLAHLCHPDDSSALLQFNNSLSIDLDIDTVLFFLYAVTPYPRTVFWDKSKDCCAWSGITCERVTGHVIALNLSYSGLQGNIHDNSSLFSLAHLQKLNLSFNDFAGSPISSSFGGFVSMTHLDLSNSNFNGRIPLEISYLSKLVSLNLSSYEGGMRLETLGFKRLVQNLTNLRELRLDYVNMSSVVLDSFMNLSSSLTSLTVFKCDLQGKFPEKNFRLPNLQKLDLRYNYELTGSIPKSNWSSQLAYLGLSATRISIGLPYLTRTLKSLSDLYLGDCNFVGSYPALLANLTQIKRLDLSYNGFGGQIPWPLLNLEGLIELDLTGNKFVGQLPEVHSNSTTISSSLYDSSTKQLVGPVPLHLTGLDLFNNSLNGTIPSWLYVLPSLEYLSLGKNQLTGNINEFQSTSLQAISLDDNKLQGMIPSSIFELVHLRLLYLSSNNLSGILEFEKFEKLQSLTDLDLSYNHLSVSFNNFSNFSLPELWLLYLSSCNITGFPYFLRASLQLESLDLSHNRIQGNAPTGLLDVGKDSLYYLNLSHNFLTGVQQLLPWQHLEYLDLRSNLLQGQLPIPPASTRVFFASNNQLTGRLPSTICNISSLEVLDLSSNSLSGEIPPCIGNLTYENLRVLDLRKNKFVGMIPATFGKGKFLRNLDLNGNELEGPLPRSLLNCKRMEVLDLGNNNINDTFPHWLESLPVLQVLILRSNQFHGAISNPKTRFPFKKLRIMDLSENQFSGHLPTKYFENLMAMVNVQEDELKYMGEYYDPDSVIVTMKGLYVELEKIQTMFTTIDFSRNCFIGEIPKVISKLNSLKGLNLSHNKLTGPIPPSFCNLTQLEWLDMSSNKLGGKIPLQLAGLTSLSKLNLSENQLVGSIPRGNQFDTFSNDSYSANLGLCGIPLSKTCTNESSSFLGEEDLEHENGIDWKVVLIGYGCGIVIGLSMGYILLSNRKVDRVMKEFGRELQRKMLRRRN